MPVSNQGLLLGRIASGWQMKTFMLPGLRNTDYVSLGTVVEEGLPHKVKLLGRQKKYV